jgi:DNA-binding CsgD family transcriptional regulator
VDEDLLDELMPLRASIPLATVEPSSRQLLTVNDPFAALFQVRPSHMTGVDLVSLVVAEQQAAVVSVLASVASGAIDSCRGRARLRRPTGAGDLPVVGWLGSVAAEGSKDRALLVLLPAEQITATAPPPLQPLDGRTILGTVDHAWRFDQISPDAEIFGWNPDDRGIPLLGLVHGDDIPLLLLAMARCSAERHVAAARVRVLDQDGGWSLVRCEVSPLGADNPPRFAVAIRPVTSDGDWETRVERLSRLEAVLERMVLEAQAEGIGAFGQGPARRGEAGPAGSGPDQPARPSLGLLTPREVELLELAATGLSNQAIAEHLTLSLNTVRTHFQKALSKLGAHSKLEAVALARREGLLRGP